MTSGSDSGRVGPALAALRKKAGLRQEDVAQRIGVGFTNVSRVEQPGSNPSIETVLKILGAIGGDLADLEAEMNPRPPDALDAEIEREQLLLESDPGRRQTYRRLWEEAGYKPDPDGPLKEVLATLRRYADLDARVLELERRMGEEEKERSSS